MTKRKAARETRAAWEAGKVAGWSAGGYGARVRVSTAGGQIRLSHQDRVTGRPKQRTLFRDTPENRAKAAAAAVILSERLHAEADARQQEEERASDAETITARQCVVLYMQRVPGFREEMLDWAAARVREWWHALPDAVRESELTPSPETLVADLSAWRRVLAHPAFAERPVSGIDLAEVNACTQSLLTSGLSVRTVTNTMDRLALAIRYVQVHHRRRIGALINPLEGRKLDRTVARTPMYTPDEVRALRASARELIGRGNYWQLFGVVGLASSGRRIGSILALTAADHDWTPRWSPEGELLPWRVTWRAEVAKARGYGRGDDVRPMTRLYADAVVWLLQRHPNPTGAGGPLIWTGDGATAPDSQTVRRQLHEVEQHADVKCVPGRAFHSFRRAVATLLADELGDGIAAEYTGMTVETLRKYSYKQVQDQVQDQAARALDVALGDAPANLSPSPK